MMLLADILAHYAFFIKWCVLVTAVFMLLSGIDDLIIDLLYWGRTLYRFLFIRRRYKPLQVEQLYVPAQQPFAVMVPAWCEDDVIRQMIENTLATYDYQNYRMFIGVYRNDPATQAEVQAMCDAHPQVQMVIVPNDGPTCKADCLNWLLQGITLYEEQQGTAFEGVVLHDAEDVVHRLELRLFNYLIGRMDLMQLPVFSLECPWYDFVAGHYIDEFAESHSKDMPVREMLTGAVPSAGVATCFSRRALRALASKEHNLVFNTDSLTEDYDISFRLKQLGMKQIFLRYGIMATIRTASPFTRRVRVHRTRDYVATREYFPNSVRTSVRQKARWVLGIVFQGWQFMGWRGNLAMRYMLWRDRRSVFTSFVTFTAYILLFNVVLLYLLPRLLPGEYLLPPLVEEWTLPWWILAINLVFLLNRMFHRMWFTGRIYGWEQALLSVPRMVVGNLIGFLASVRALRLYITHRLTGKKLVWDKTAHAYPSATQLRYMRRRLGELLVERNLITEHILEVALERQKQDPDHPPLGEVLLSMHAVALPALADALAQHMGIPLEEAMLKLDHAQKEGQ